VLIENVAVLRSAGSVVVVDALARMDYLCWWDCVPALAVGAPHLRDRVWVTAVRADEMPDLDGRPSRRRRPSSRVRAR
jgi:DNA (cytosine-5)-methyltransferase 1